jgi:hypothetical protein
LRGLNCATVVGGGLLEMSVSFSRLIFFFSCGGWPCGFIPTVGFGGRLGEGRRRNPKKSCAAGRQVDPLDDD